MNSNKNPSSKLKSNVKGKLKQSITSLTGLCVFFKQLNITNSEYAEQLQSPTAWTQHRAASSIFDQNSIVLNLWCVPKAHQRLLGLSCLLLVGRADGFLDIWWPFLHLSSCYWLRLWHLSCSHCDQTAASWEHWVRAAKSNRGRNVRLQLCPQWHTRTSKVTAGSGGSCIIQSLLKWVCKGIGKYLPSIWFRRHWGVPHREQELCCFLEKFQQQSLPWTKPPLPPSRCTRRCSPMIPLVGEALTVGRFFPSPAPRNKKHKLAKTPQNSQSQMSHLHYLHDCWWYFLTMCSKDNC